ncbi:MAG TPA: ABC transporter permease [bacterium]|nr:ABC transporter permease [bacterium]
MDRGSFRRRWLRRRILRPLVSFSVITFAVTALTFAITDVLPGDLAVAILGESATADQLAGLRMELGLNRPAWVRYGEWLWQALHGNLGRSYRSNEAVSRMLADRLPVTFELILISQLIALGVAIPVGMLSAYLVRSRFDRVAGALSLGFLSLPAFVIGFLLIYGFAVYMRWLPAAGYRYWSDGVAVNLRSIALPAFTLAAAEFPVYMRLLRSDMIATLQQDFVLVARAKGLAPWQILLKHALKPSSLSLITVVGVNAGRLVGGAVIVESLFDLPGVGQMLVTAVYQKDYFAIQGIVLVVAVGFAAINVAVEASYALLDPRVRHALRR